MSGSFRGQHTAFLAVVLSLLLLPARDVLAREKHVKTPPSAAKRCGDALLDTTETCASCPQDCVAQPCRENATELPVAVKVTFPKDRPIAGVTVALAYRTSSVGLPGSAAETSIRNRIADTPADAVVAAYDKDYLVRIVVSRAEPIRDGRLLTVRFDRCEGAPRPSAQDFSCAMAGCATVFGEVDGCSCAVALH